MRRYLTFALCSAALVLGGLSAHAQDKEPSKRAEFEAKYGIYPIAYRELIMRWLGEQLIDPASAEVEWIEEPKAVVVNMPGKPPFAGYKIDFKVNSRNKFGMYTGKQGRRVYIRNGTVVGGGLIPR